MSGREKFLHRLHGFIFSVMYKTASCIDFNKKLSKVLYRKKDALTKMDIRVVKKLLIFFKKSLRRDKNRLMPRRTASKTSLRSGEPARWYSGKSVRIAVGRPGVHSLSRVIPKD